MVVAFAPDTGNTATIVFGTSAFVAKYHEIGGTEQEVPKIKDSHLGTVAKETYQPGDLYEPGEVDCEFQFNSTIALPPLGQAPETVTITYPVPTGKTTGATLAGTAFISKRKTTSLKNNELVIGNYTLCWDGKTGPTFTPAA